MKTPRSLEELLIRREQAISILMEGGVGVMPSDTVYGLVARAHDPQAVTRMYALKDRDHKPGTIIAASVEQLIELGVSRSNIDKVSQWWPNPLSAVLDMNGNDYLHQGVGDIAMRVVSDLVLQTLLQKTGPLLTSSANLPGQPESKTIAQAYDYFKEAVDFYIDGGVIADALPSTIIRPDADGITILRQGSIRI
jgi:L-threonylcarbamoyladenylate synthase